MQRDRARDQRQFEVGIDRLLSFEVYPADVVSSVRVHGSPSRLVEGRFAACGRPTLVPLAVWTDSRIALGLCAATGVVVECEKPRAAPGRAGDDAGDRRQARIRCSLPVETLACDHDCVALALILANQHGAGFELPARWTALACEAVQEPQAVAIKSAKGLLLQVMGDHAPEQVLAQSRRRLAAEDCLPAPPKRFGRKRADASDLGRDRGLLCHRLAHGYACG
jgi:hypothetical protein